MRLLLLLARSHQLYSGLLLRIKAKTLWRAYTAALICGYFFYVGLFTLLIYAFGRKSFCRTSYSNLVDPLQSLSCAAWWEIAVRRKVGIWWPLHNGVMPIIMKAEDGHGVNRATRSKHTNTAARCATSSKSRQLPEIALIGPWIIQCHFFFPPPKRTLGAIDESGWIFNGSESLGQAGARDDKLREIKQKRGEWEKEVAQWGVA